MKPHLCSFCGKSPTVKPLTVFYSTARKTGQHEVFRVECDNCGAHGKCRPDSISAVVSWNEPWQARPVTRKYLAWLETEVTHYVNHLRAHDTALHDQMADAIEKSRGKFRK